MNRHNHTNPFRSRSRAARRLPRHLKWWLATLGGALLVCGAITFAVQEGQVIRARHIKEVRAVVAARFLGCKLLHPLLPMPLWSEPVISDETPIRTTHIEELRQAINRLRDVPEVGLPPYPFSNEPLRPDTTPIKADHINELWDALQGTACQSCTCGDWSLGACGAGDCLSTERSQTRSCSPAQCDRDSECIPDPTCGSCTCGSWSSPGACGTGGCSPDKRPQTRSCSPGGCSEESQCIPDAACGSCMPDGTCSAPTPACGQVTWGTDSCGDPCSKTGPSCGGCVPPQVPGSADLCPGDADGVTGTPAGKVVTICSSPPGSEPKCEYTCRSGYHPDGFGNCAPDGCVPYNPCVAGRICGDVWNGCDMVSCGSCPSGTCSPDGTECLGPPPCEWSVWTNVGCYSVPPGECGADHSGCMLQVPSCFPEGCVPCSSRWVTDPLC